MGKQNPSLKGLALLAAVSMCRGAFVCSSRAAESALPASRILLASGFAGGSGSTVGPDGALYVTEGAIGQVTRVEPVPANDDVCRGTAALFVGLGGAIDVAFIGWTAYVLVTLVGRTSVAST